MLQVPLIRVRVVRPGQADAMKSMHPPCEVREALERLGISANLTMEMRDSLGFTMGRADTMEAGDYTLTVARPEGEPQYKAS